MFHNCESAHSDGGCNPLDWSIEEGRVISSKSEEFDDCVILSRDAFDPDAVFLEDIVDDDVLPYLSLEVDGLTTHREARRGRLELRPEDAAANEPVAPDTTMPVVAIEPQQLEVYGWEPSLWKKIRRYLGF
jgi:hypothetical protein